MAEKLEPKGAPHDEPPLGSIVAYAIKGEPHLAWREPGARQENPYHWHVLHSMSYGWRRWDEIVGQDDVRVLGSAGPVQSGELDALP